MKHVSTFVLKQAYRRLQPRYYQRWPCIDNGGIKGNLVFVYWHFPISLQWAWVIWWEIFLKEGITSAFMATLTISSSSLPMFCVCVCGLLKWLMSTCCSVAKSCPTLWDYMHWGTRLLCLPLSPRIYSNSFPLSQWCYLIILSSAALFSFCLQSFPASGSFPMRQFFASGCQSIGASASASVLPMNIKGLISLLSKGFLRVFSSTAVQKHQFFSPQPSLCYNSHICTWLLEKP